MTLWTRRQLLGQGALALGAIAAGTGDSMAGKLRALEAATGGGRLGVLMLDTGSGRSSGYKQEERFAMCSTFKMLLAARVLDRVDRGEELLQRQIAIPAAGLAAYSPLTGEHKGGTMAVDALCRAAVTRSDNEAANLLLETIGGPAGLTRFTQSLGDSVTRLDRNEPALNEAKPGDPRDTTTPAAILADWRKLLLGNALKPGSRDLLTAWLIGNQTGAERLRQGIGDRAGWTIGDKTGSSDETCNDIAILWPAGRAPVLVAAFLTQCPGTDAARNHVIAQVGRLAGEWIG